MDGVTAAPSFQRRLEEPDQILGLLLDLDLTVAQQPENALRDDGKTREQMIEEKRDHLLDRQKPDSAARQTDESVDRGRDQGQRLKPNIVADPLELERQAEPAIGDKRKRMSRVERQRRQDRKDLGHKPVFEPLAITRLQIARIDDARSRFVELPAQREPGDLLVGHQLAGPLPDRLELLRRGEPVLAQRLDPGKMLAFQPGHPHHIKFVEIVGRDRQKAQPLEQRMTQIVGLGEHPLVEGEPGELAIDKACLGMEIDRLDLDRLRAGAHYRSPDGAEAEPVAKRSYLSG